jgi:hypothetical protein
VHHRCVAEQGVLAYHHRHRLWMPLAVLHDIV